MNTDAFPIKTLAWLEQLLAFDTISANPNRALVDCIELALKDWGASVQRLENTDGSKANLYATIGPQDKAGILLSGHTDVVPVAGQAWTVPAFTMTLKNDRAYGRGSADMKGFVACALQAAHTAAKRKLSMPLHLGFSYDEEIGCVGVRSMVDMLTAASVKPLMCIVGEPTELNVVVGHKGKVACHVVCTGRAGHSAMAPLSLNAIHLATDLIQFVRSLQKELEQTPSRNPGKDYSVPYTTLHVSNLKGGKALNIVPEHCSFDLEIRYIANDDAEAILQKIRAEAKRLADNAKIKAAEASIEIEPFNRYPGLETGVDDPVVRFVQSLTDANQLGRVDFGTEGGLFSSVSGIPTVVCGPGSMDQGHKADEYIELDQLARCDRMLLKLLDHLETGSLD